MTRDRNRRGQDLPLYMSGARMVGYYGMDVVHDLAGLSHMICYFAGQASISVTACRKLLPDPAHYAACLQQAMDALQQAAGAGEVKKPVASKRRQAVPKKLATNADTSLEISTTTAASTSAAAKPKSAATRRSTRSKAARQLHA